MNRSVKIPGPDHPISIEPNPSRVTVRVGGTVIADTRRALTLREADYPAVEYIPEADIVWPLLTATGHRTYCPYKGDCSYFTIASGSDVRENAAWAYAEPYEAVARIRKHVAFYGSRVDAISQQEE